MKYENINNWRIQPFDFNRKKTDYEIDGWNLDDLISTNGKF